MRVAVITPYFRETKEQLARCLESVRDQTVKSDHFLVSDGHPQDWLDAAGVRHLRLGRSHSDYGNTPRGIGGQLAISEDYDAICYLDADNWYDPQHVQVCLDAASLVRHCDVVIAKRRLVRPDFTVMPVADEPGHVDTNCLFLLSGAFHMAPYWNLMPRMYSAMGDRLFMMSVRSRRLNHAMTEVATVNYLYLWPLAYGQLGEQMPEGVKEPINASAIFESHAKLGEREKEIASRRLGMELKVGVRKR